MVKLEEMKNEVIKPIIQKLIKEEINKDWVKDLLLQKKFIASHYGRDLCVTEFFDLYIWDNLTPEQQEKVLEALNVIIEEDLNLKIQPATNYWFYLLDFAVLLEKKMPGVIDSKPFLIWKEKNYPNLSHSKDREHPAIKELNQKIKNAFQNN